RRRHTIFSRDWSSDVCSSDLIMITERQLVPIINEVKDELPPLTVVVHDPKKDDHDFREDVAHIQLDQKFNSLPYDEFIFSNETRSEERRVGKECRSHTCRDYY